MIAGTAEASLSVGPDGVAPELPRPGCRYEVPKLVSSRRFRVRAIESYVSLRWISNKAGKSTNNMYSARKMNVNLAATLQFIVYDGSSLAWGGSGIAVWRNRATLDVFVATAAHVVDTHDKHQIFVIDATNKRYSNPVVVLLDRSNDLAIVRVSGLPASFPLAVLGAVYGKGDDVYVIGWPLLSDVSSVSGGMIRSDRFTNDGVNEVVFIDAPVFGGNSGGGVFLKKTHALVGIVSWKIGNTESMVAAVPQKFVYQALLTIQYETPPLDPSAAIPYYRNHYYLGVGGDRMSPFLSSLYLLDSGVEPIRNRGNGGVRVVSVARNSPAESAGLRSADAATRSFDIIWAISAGGSPPPPWVPLTEEMTIHQAIQDIADAATPRRRNFNTSIISSNTSLLKILEVSLPNTLLIRLLCSQVLQGIHTGKFVSKTLSLPLRRAFLETYPSQRGEGYVKHEKSAEIHARYEAIPEWQRTLVQLALSKKPE
jgi:S1-C subfamily serine protease